MTDMTKGNSPGPLYFFLEACSYSFYSQGHLILSSICPSGWAAMENHLKSQEVMNLLRQEVWLANESFCLLQKSVAMAIRSFLWMPTCGSVYAGLDASLKGICSSSLVTCISVSAHLISTDKSLLSITKSHKPQSFNSVNPSLILT